jgi:hypothetical protein
MRFYSGLFAAAATGIRLSFGGIPDESSHCPSRG